MRRSIASSTFPRCSAPPRSLSPLCGRAVRDLTSVLAHARLLGGCLDDGEVAVVAAALAPSIDAVAGEHRRVGLPDASLAEAWILPAHPAIPDRALPRGRLDRRAGAFNLMRLRSQRRGDRRATRSRRPPSVRRAGR